MLKIKTENSLVDIKVLSPDVPSFSRIDPSEGKPRQSSLGVATTHTDIKGKGRDNF